MNHTDISYCIKIVYQYLYKRAYENEKYIFNWNEKSLNLFNKFYELLKKQYNINCIGKRFIVGYFLFHFCRLMNLNIERYSTKKDDKILKYGRYQIVDFLSRKSFFLWINRNTNFDYKIFLNEDLTKYKIIVNDIFKLLENKDEIEESIVEYEDTIRLRQYNTDSDIFNCSTNYIFFHPLSQLCIECKSNQECIGLMKVNSNRLYEVRINE